MAEYTKGERSIVHTTKGNWVVTVGGGLHTPRTTIGSFVKEQDALLDKAAPKLLEALKVIKAWAEKKSELTGENNQVIIAKCYLAIAEAEVKK